MTPETKVNKAPGFEFKFCPCCTKELTYSPKVDRNACDADDGGCGFVHWDSPVPVVAGLIPFPERFIGQEMVEGPFDFDIDEYRDVTRTGIVLIQRGIEPFQGRWAFPGGFLNRKETPRAGVVREIDEETGLLVEVEKVIHPCNPLPGRLNQVVIPWLARPVGGRMRAGDDAQNIGIFGKDNLPDLCFTSHIKTIQDWFAGKYGTITGRKAY